MLETRYLFRLDDACPWMDKARWSALEAVFDRFNVHPLVGVVPHCEDPGIQVDVEDPLFWERARAWQAKGWTIGLHGWDHVFVGHDPGLVPLNNYTEFAGRPEAEQRQKIRSGWQALTAQGLSPEVWIAPAHTFDATTLRCLAEETPIRVISDGLSSRPFRRFGMVWLPQQLWKPRSAPPGLWTICLHPNELDNKSLLAVEAFLTTHSQVIGLSDVGPIDREWGLTDALFELPFRMARAVKRSMRKAK